MKVPSKRSVLTIDKSRLKEQLTHLDEQYLKSLEFPLLISIGVEKRRSL